MASTTVPPRSPAVSGGERAAPTLVPGPGRQRRWSLALLAVLLTLGSALAFVVLWLNAGGRHPVLAVRRDVAAGQIIQAEDITVVRVATDAGLQPLSSSARDDVIGQPAATDLLAGSLLVPAAVGDDEGLEPGRTVVAIPVPVAELPSSQLETGDRVLLIRTPDDNAVAAVAAEAETIGDGRVFEVEAGDEGDTTVRVSVSVDESIALEVASAIRSDQIYVAQANPR